MTDLIDRLLGGYERGAISRRDLILGLSAMALGSGSAAAQAQAAPFPARTLNHVTLFASDVDRSVAFYQRLFGMPVLSRQENGINLATGDGSGFLGIYEAGTSEPRLHHVCLGVQGFDPGTIVARLAEHGVPNARVRMRGATPEVYLTDPDSISVQLQDPGYCGGRGGDGRPVRMRRT
jgi:catechol 2,3-dioxygenase-like lactoylglutathione lyase family enzyme